MKNKLKLPKRHVRRTLKALDIEIRKNRLRDDTGTAYRLKAGPCRGVVVTVYDTGTVLVQGKEERASRIRTLLEAVAEVVKTGF